MQRYFRATLKDGQPIVAAATVELAGTINLSANEARWKPFTSRQRVITRRPGFLWDAQVSMLPGVMVRVVDSHIAGEGLLRAAILGLFTVAKARGGGELARGEFMTSLTYEFEPRGRTLVGARRQRQHPGEGGPDRDAVPHTRLQTIGEFITDMM